MHGRTHNFSTIQPAPANRKPDCKPVDRNRLGFPGIMALVQKTEHQSHISRNVHALFIRNGRAHPLHPFKMNCSVYNSELTVYSKESTIMSERATAPTTAPAATSAPVASAASAASAENLPEPNAKLTTREKKWIVYDVGNSAFVMLSTAVVPIYANSLLQSAGQSNIVST